MKKVLFTLNIGGSYAPDITALTYPLLEKYAKKCGAEFCIITERKFPDWPVTYEKMQVYELGWGYDWIYAIDSDALVHPDFFDPTIFISKDTVLQNDRDRSFVRFDPDLYMLRDGRWIGAGNWFTVASDWCTDVWKPLDDISFEQAVNRIHVTQEETRHGITREHLIDDFTMTRNIARFGLKFETLKNLVSKLGLDSRFHYLVHDYLNPEDGVSGKAAFLNMVRDVRWGIK